MGLLVLTVTAHSQEIVNPETDLIPKDTQLWTEGMLWHQETILRAGVGYDDNVVLSADHASGSGFVGTGLDFTATRLPLDGWLIVAGISGEDRRYWRDVGLASGDTYQDSALASVRVQRNFPDDWQTGLELRGIYDHEVLDVSTLPTAPGAVLVDGYGISVRPSVRRDGGSGWWAQLETPVSRWDFESPLDSYWEGGVVATLGYHVNTNCDLSVAYTGSYVAHDQWHAIEYYGRFALPQLLAIWKHQAQVEWRQYWDSARHWRSSTSLAFASFTDNGSGYFNYDQYQAVQTLSWQDFGWQVQAAAQVAYEDYAVQRNGFINGPNLYRTLMDFSLGVDRQLLGQLKAYAKVQYRRSISNEAISEYTGTVVSGGLSWGF